MKILFLSHHWTNNSHHSQYSGFQRLVFHAAKENEVTLITWGLENAAYTDVDGIHIITVKAGKKDYLFLKRVKISLQGRKISSNFDAVHALYSDCTFFLRKNSFTVTFHILPGIAKYSAFKQRAFLFLKYNLLQKRAMRRAKDIVCISTNLLARIPTKYQHKARFIPHGVDTEFWNRALSMPCEPQYNKYILCVGTHGLDRKLLEKFIVANAQARFIIVGMNKRLAGFSNVDYQYNISDEKLRSLYAWAEFLVKPVTFSTANNSVLEALSTGSTILTNRIPGITDYLNDANCIFIDTLNNLSLENIISRKLEPSFVREFAVGEFSWTRVLKEYFKLYTQKR
jgi:glycosyltransferase involved in cell wall biosynthesis